MQKTLKRVLGPTTCLVMFSAAFLGLGSSCKTRSSSSLASALNPIAVKKIVDQGKGRYQIIFADQDQSLKNNAALTVKYRVVSGWSRDPVDCNQITSTPERVAFAANNSDSAIAIQINPKEFNRCNSNDAARKEFRKVSLDCQKSGKWNGARLVEACLMDSNNKVVAAGRMTPEKPEAAEGMSLAVRVSHSDDVLNYGKVCAERLGPLPRDWSCMDGQTIPITNNGEEIPFGQHKLGQTCDKTIYLGLGDQGQCVPYARLLRLYTKKDVETVVICRRYKMGVVGPDNTLTQPISPDVPLVQDVAIVQHNIKTGETCFFQALSGFQETERDLPVARVPPPSEETIPADIIAKYASLPADQQPVAAKDFWILPSDPGTSASEPNFQCIICHDSDPFMHSPYVDQVNFDFKFQPSSAVLFGGKRTRDNLVNPGLGAHPFEGKADKMVPCDPGPKGPIKNGEVPSQLCVFNKVEGVNEAKGKYSLVHETHQRSFPNTWNVIPKTPAGELDDTCTKCHRIGSLETCRMWVPDSIGEQMVSSNSERSKYGSGFPLTHWMPVIQAEDFMASTGKCKPDLNNPEKSANCSFGLAEWRQRFETGAKRMSNCCALTANSTNKDPNLMPEFAAQCQAFPITAPPPGTGGVVGSFSLQGKNAAIGVNGKESALIALSGDISGQAGKLSHVLLNLSLTHKSPGDITIALQHNGQSVEVFNGQKDLQRPNKPITDFKLQIDSADFQSTFLPLMNQSPAGDWSLLVKDEGDLDSGSVDKISVEVGLN